MEMWPEITWSSLSTSDWCGRHGQCSGSAAASGGSVAKEEHQRDFLFPEGQVTGLMRPHLPHID